MNKIQETITAFSVCKLIEEASKKEQNPNVILKKYLNECENIGGNSDLFLKIATRELTACRLIEENGMVVDTPITNSVAAGGISGFKPDEIGVPVQAQKRYAAKNSIFRRRKPNKYYNDETGNY